MKVGSGDVRIVKNEPDLFSSSHEKEYRVLYLDTETTGTDIDSTSIVEIAAVLKVYSGFSADFVEKRVFSSFVNPLVEIPPEASAVHHITDKMVEDAPAIQDISDDMGELVSLADFVCAHNIPFDLPILGRQLPAVFKEIPSDMQLDSLRLSRHVWGTIPSHALQTLRYRFNLDSNIVGDAHRALFDTELCSALIEYIVRKKLTSSDSWDKLAALARSPLNVQIFSFGKYRGKLVDDIISDDAGYIRWLLKQDWITNDYPDLYHTILKKSKGEKQ